MPKRRTSEPSFVIIPADPLPMVPVNGASLRQWLRVRQRVVDMIRQHGGDQPWLAGAAHVVPDMPSTWSAVLAAVDARYPGGRRDPAPGCDLAVTSAPWSTEFVELAGWIDAHADAMPAVQKAALKAANVERVNAADKVRDRALAFYEQLRDTPDPGYPRQRRTPVERVAEQLAAEGMARSARSLERMLYGKRANLAA